MEKNEPDTWKNELKTNPVGVTENQRETEWNRIWVEQKKKPKIHVNGKNPVCAGKIKLGI